MILELPYTDFKITMLNKFEEVKENLKYITLKGNLKRRYTHYKKKSN